MHKWTKINDWKIWHTDPKKERSYVIKELTKGEYTVYLFDGIGLKIGTTYSSLDSAKRFVRKNFGPLG